MGESSPVRVYYLASGPIGIPILEALRMDARIRLCGIGTQPDRPSGRRRSPTPTPVKAAGTASGLMVETHESVNCPAFLERLRALDVELLVVASFGQLLREPVLELPPYGCFNVHASLLPRHRGAAPIAAAILAGDTETGISFMRMDRGLDTGPVYEVWKLPVRPDDTAGILEERLGRLAASRVADCIWRVAREGLAAVPQPEEGVTYARRLRKEDARIDWSRSAAALERQIRAYLPWPVAFTTLAARGRDLRLQIVAAAVESDAAVETRDEDVAGTTVAASPAGWLVRCGAGTLRIQRVVPAGRREMSAEEFLRGFPVSRGTRLGA